MRFWVAVGVCPAQLEHPNQLVCVTCVQQREKKKACRHFALPYMHWTLVNLLKTCRSLPNVSLWYLWRSIKYCASVMKLVLCCEIVCGRHYDIEKKAYWCTHIAIDLLLWCWGTIVRRCSTSGDSGDSAKMCSIIPFRQCVHICVCQDVPWKARALMKITLKCAAYVLETLLIGTSAARFNMCKKLKFRWLDVCA